MRFVEASIKEDFIHVRYQGLWKLSFEDMLDRFQLFLEDCDNRFQLFLVDCDDDFQTLEYQNILDSKNFKLTNVPRVLFSSLPKFEEERALIFLVPEFKEERAVISLSGHSRKLNMDIMMTLYKDSNFADFTIISTPEIRELFKKNENLLFDFVSMLEINSYCRAAKRKGMEETYFALNHIDEEHRDIVNSFKNSSIYRNCNYINYIDANFSFK